MKLLLTYGPFQTATVDKSSARCLEAKDCRMNMGERQAKRVTATRYIDNNEAKKGRELNLAFSLAQPTRCALSHWLVVRSRGCPESQ